MLLSTLLLACAEPPAEEQPREWPADCDGLIADVPPFDASAVDSPDWLFEVPDGDLSGWEAPTFEIVLPPSSIETLRAYDTDLRVWDALPDDTESAPRSPVVCAALITPHGGFPKIAVKLKGKLGSSYRSIDHKPYFQVRLDERDPSVEMLGVRSFRLYNLAEDESFAQRYLGFAVWNLFSSEPYPAPRAGFATVRLNGQDMGLYGTTEELDRRFIERWTEQGFFATSVGRLYEGEYGMDLHAASCAGETGEDPCYTTLEYEGPEDVDGAFTDLERLVDAAAGPDEALCTALAPHLDLEQFLRFWALETVIGAREGYTYLTNNYYLYNDADPAGTSDRFVFLPVGFDQVMFDDKDPCAAQAELPRRIIQTSGSCRDQFVDTLAEVRNAIDWAAVEGETTRIRGWLDARRLPEARPMHNLVEVRAMRLDVAAYVRSQGELAAAGGGPLAACPQ